MTRIAFRKGKNPPETLARVEAVLSSDKPMTARQVSEALGDLVPPTVRHVLTEIEIAAEMDRRGSVIECLEQKIARSDSIMKDIRRLLVRCHDRIHSLPRTSDTELAASIEQLLGRIASELGAPRNG